MAGMMAAMRWGAFLGLALFGAMVVAACGDDSSGSSGDPPKKTYGDGTCGTCFATQCDTEIAACGADPGCAAYYTCLLDCPLDPIGNPDPTCEAACPASESSTSQQLKGQLTLCRLDTAGVACGCDIGFRDQQCSTSAEANACYKCEEENCCDTYAACHESADCEALVDCMQACPIGDPICDSDCAFQYGDAMAIFGPRLGCISSECNTECGGNTCSTCVMDNCGESSVACNSRPDCWALGACVGECAGSETCIQTCLDTYPDANDLFWIDGYCKITFCELECS